MCTCMGGGGTCVRVWGEGVHVYVHGGRGYMCTCMGGGGTCVRVWGEGVHVYVHGGRGYMCTCMGGGGVCNLPWLGTLRGSYRQIWSAVFQPVPSARVYTCIYNMTTKT